MNALTFGEFSMRYLILLALKYGLYNILIMEEKQTIVALGAGSITKLVLPDGRIERSENIKDVLLYMEKTEEMLKRKEELFSLEKC